MPPTMAPLAIPGKYLWTFFLISSPRIPPLIDSFPSSSTIFSPNNHVRNFLLLDNSPRPAPTAAPNTGPPANPSNIDNPAPATPPEAILGKYFPKLPTTSFITSLPSDLLSLLSALLSLPETSLTTLLSIRLS